MDDLEIDSIISPGGSNKGAINTGLSFKISEPYGMTLLNSLVCKIAGTYINMQQTEQ